MDQIKKLLELQSILDTILEKMSALKNDVDDVTLCLQLKKIISKDVSFRVIEGLQEINALYEKCQKLYKEVDLKKELSEDIDDIKLTITMAVSDFELDVKLEKYKYFLNLVTEEKEIAVQLNGQKEKLKSILRNFNIDSESELEPFDKFIEAITEIYSSNSDYSKLMGYMTDLSSVFGSQLVGKTFIEKTIYLPENSAVKNLSVSEKNGICIKENEKAEIIENAVEEVKKENQPNECINASNELVNIKQDSFSDESASRGLLIAEDFFSGSFYADISAAENKKTGVKVFINDMKARHAVGNAFTIKTLHKYNSVTAELVAITYELLSKEEIELSLDYLQSKGYARKYGINDIGSFYCISPKGEKALATAGVRSFLRLKDLGTKGNGELLEDSLHPVLTRIAYSKLLTLFLKYLGNRSVNVSDSIWPECFATKIVNSDRDRKFLFTGAFWNKNDEVQEYIQTLSKNLTEDCELVVIAGLNMDMVKKLSAFIIEKIGLDTVKVYCYALIEDKFVAYDGRQVQIDSILSVSDSKEAGVHINIKAIENEVVKESSIDITDGEIFEIDENNIFDEPQKGENSEFAEETSKTAAKDRSEEIKNKETFLNNAEKKEIVISVAVEEARSNAFQMIADGKIYCATAYLSSLMDDNEEIKNLHDKISYAVNAPTMRCSYSSQSIFSLYFGENDIFSKYLMVAATLRNFFMNHVCYDYNMKSLHASTKEIPVVKDSAALTHAIYSLVVFKENVKKGIDYYADYKVRDQVKIERALEALVIEAKSYYDSYVSEHIKENTSNKRFIETRKSIFTQDGNLAEYLKAIVDGDYEFAEMIAEYLKETFIKEDCSIEYSNIDTGKINDFVDFYWDKAGDSMRVARRTSNLVSRLRSNLIKAIEKILCVMCEWIALVEATSSLKDDDGTRRYKEIKKDLTSDLCCAKAELEEKHCSMDVDEISGAILLENTLEELVSRLDGTYDERRNKYYHVDFLRGNSVLLEDTYRPDMRGNFDDFQNLSLPNRILLHSKEELASFEEKLDDIFNNYGDDYGTAELIVKYLKDMGDTTCTEKYDIKKSEEMAELYAKQKLEDFIENLELAQSYGQIEETKENKKEKIQKIANDWFAYAAKSKNYGFFNRILDQYREKISEDAKVRGYALLQELDQIKVQYNHNERIMNRIVKINEMIDKQNYTVAEDLLARINNDESDESIEVTNCDYLKKYISDYDYNYKTVADSSRKLSDLVSNKTRNKDDKGARRLLDNWMSNGQPLGKNKLSALLDALGFTCVNVNEQAKMGKIDNYLVFFDEEKNGRKVNYKHPIAAFGSKAGKEGLRIVCLFGRYDADRLIEEFKNIAGTKNTLILLDYALSLSDRRRLARKIKSDMNDKVFAVLDRVLLMFLVNNYSVQFINQILMSVMMPFSYYQPYVWDSSKVMPPEIFMGRKDQLEKIESPAGVNIVYGGRQLGKSALLKRAKMNIDYDENNNRAVLVEIKGLNYKKAANKIGHELYDVGVFLEDIDTTDWDVLARAIKRRLQDNNLPQIPYLLLLLDEADAFIESCEEVCFQPFDALKDIQGVGMDRFKFVIAGLHNIVRFKREAALSKNSVLTHLTSITVKPFNKREARLLLEEPLYYLGFRFPVDKQSLVSLIIANTNYFPGLIQLYCANLIEAMRKSDYAGYDQVDTPVYEIRENHIKKVLSDPNFMNQIREKFEITLKLDEDNMYYIIALLMAYLYHQNTNSASESDGFSARDIINVGKEYGVKKITVLNEDFVNIEGLLQELVELNILRQTVNDLYLFSRYSFFQMMGTALEVENRLLKYMED